MATILSHKAYSDLIAMGGRLFIYKWLIPRDVTDRLIYVELLSNEEVVKMCQVMLRGVVGNCALGLVGAVIGMATTPSSASCAFLLRFDAGTANDDLSKVDLIVSTTDETLIKHLKWREEQL